MEIAGIELVRREIEKTISAYQRFHDDDTLLGAVAEVGRVCGAALQQGNKIMLAGNGGSAADSQHIAAEFIGRLSNDRQPLPALALTTNSSVLTATANDFGYENVFSRQIVALGRPEDVFIGISTSGKSPNILRALQAAKEKGITTVGLTGACGVAMRSLCDHLLCIPSESTQNIQELHIMIGHTITAIAESSFLTPE